MTEPCHARTLCAAQAALSRRPPPPSYTVEAEAAAVEEDVEEFDMRREWLKLGASGGGSFTMMGMTAVLDSPRVHCAHPHAHTMLCRAISIRGRRGIRE